MAVPDIKLSFSSSRTRPLAYRDNIGVSLSQFRADVQQLAAELRGDGDLLLTCDGRYAFGVALLAAWVSARSVILPPNRLHATLADIRRRLPIAHECDLAWEQSLKPAATDSVPGHGLWELSFPQGKIAAKLFTSGSTGEPKMIAKTIGNLLHEANRLRHTFDWPDAPIAATVPPQHLYGLTFSLLLPWVLGVPWIDQTPLYAQDITALVHHNRAGTLISIPIQYKALVQERPEFQDLVCVSATAPLSATTSRQWVQQQSREILEIYGSTETGVVAFRYQLSEPSWQALNGVTTTDRSGLLHVRSPFVSCQWPDGFQTADRVKTVDAHRFHLLGRADSVVKIGGKRVSLSAIEQTLLDCSGIVDAAVIAVKTDGMVRDQAIWAAVVMAKGQHLSATELRRQLRGTLDGIEMPKRILFVEKLPRTGSGKLPRRDLEYLFQDKE